MLVLVAVLVTACAQARAESPDFTPDLDEYVTEAALQADAVAALGLPEGFHLPASTPIDRPSGFPSVDELSPMVLSGNQPYSRARITSCLSLVEGAEVYEAAGMEIGELDQVMTITYFDGLVIWDDPDGFRQIFFGGMGSLYLGDDGEWHEATGYEWDVIGPLADWSVAQSAAALVLDDAVEIVGYELVADTPTVRVSLVKGEERSDVWLDETGAALRIVQDFRLGGVTRWVGVWSVETLAPELTGPLPVAR